MIKSIPGLDIALIKLQGSNFPYVRLADEGDAVYRDQPVTVMGYPFGDKTERDYSTFLGTVASVDQRDEYGTRAFYNGEGKRGNSGSPVLDRATGAVLGVFCGSIMDGDPKLMEEINYFRPIGYFWRHFTQSH